MELKFTAQGVCHDLESSSNRTFMELKSVHGELRCRISFGRSNRTFMELKLSSCKIKHLILSEF